MWTNGAAFWLGVRTNRPLALGLLLVACLLLGWFPARASAYLTALSFTTEDPSRIASFAVEKPGEVQVSPVDFPPGATDTDLIGLSFRPQSEDLYAMGAGGTLYVLQGPPWRAVPVNQTPAVSPIEGSSFGFAFNPVRDAISVIDDAGQNLLVNPFNGEVTNDGTLGYPSDGFFAGVKPVPTGAAFVGSAPASTSTTMYVLDSATDWLMVQGPERSPDAGAGGVLHLTSGSVGLDVTSAGGLASWPGSTNAAENLVALLQPAGGGPQKLCGIATSGRSSCYLSGSVGASQPLEGLALVPPSVIHIPHYLVEGTFSNGADVTIERHGGLKRSVTVEYRTQAPSLHGSGLSGFVIPPGQLTFEKGERVKTLHVDIPSSPSAEKLGGYIELNDSSPDTFLSQRWAHVVVRREGPLSVHIVRPKSSLGRILRRHELDLRYTCSLTCDSIMKLRMGRVEVANFAALTQARGPHVATFDLDREARQTIRRHVSRSGVGFVLRGRFQSEPETVRESLRFRLRR
jgi:hypothetical protein